MTNQELKYLTMQEIAELTDREKQIISEIGFQEFLRRRQYPRNKMIGFKTDNETFQKIVKESTEQGITISRYLHNFFSE
jgi:hypothetical protein